MMRDRLLFLPPDDAPLSVWCLPLSGRCSTRVAAWSPIEYERATCGQPSLNKAAGRLVQKLGMRDKVAPVYAGGKTLPILSPAQKRECAKLREGGMTWTDIAKRFGVHRNTVRRAVVGRSMDDR